MGNSEVPAHDIGSPRWFATTRWAVIINASSDDEARSQEALSTLCQTYWQPVNGYIRGRGYDVTDAEDLTQQFFAKFLEKRQYAAADRERGRFRSFVLACVKNFIGKEWDRRHAQKRGGGAQHCSLEELTEDGAVHEPVDGFTPDKLFDQNWAIALLARVRSRIQAEYAADNKKERFDVLEKLLPGEGIAPTYAEIAKMLGVAEGTVKSEVHRFKRRYAFLVREELAHTVGDQADIEAELQHLRSVIGRPG
jgi:RNA polymerase sigma-70 factor (ECF subfamily)